jgi:predicted ATPase/DNA-binding CsgD family transcriptional regulator
VLELAALPMLGRAVEQAEVLAALREPGTRLVTVTGRGGVGKTRLAVEVVRALRAETEKLVVVVPLAGVLEPDLVVAEIAASLGVTAAPHPDLQGALADHLRSETALLVLDNFEHVLPAAPDVRALLDRCPELRILVTSQAPLRLECERVLALSPLPVPAPGEHDPGALLDYAAVGIYCNRAAAVQRTFALHDTNAAAVAALCRHLEGLPLAIELAAARAATLPAAEVLRHLDHARLEIVRRPRGDAPDRHDDLRGAIQWSYDVLTPAAQCLLRRLSLISGTFDLDAALHLDGGADFGDVVDQLETLVDFHLVDPVSAGEVARFHIASSIRAFGREQLAATRELETASRAHIAYRASQARAAAIGVDGDDEVVWLEMLQADHDDLVAALHAALDAALTDAALDLACGLASLWSMRGYYAPQAELLERALKLGANAETPTLGYANALLWSGFLGFEHGTAADPAVLLDQLERGEALARGLGDDATLLRALAHWLVVTPYTGDIARAVRASEEGLELAERTGHYRWLGQIEAWSGMLANELGDEARAAELGRSAVARARRHGDGRTLVLATMMLLPLRRKYPELAADTPSTEEALHAARTTGLAMYEAILLPMMVNDALRAGDRTAALQLAVESLSIARSRVGTPIAGYNLMTMLSVAAACGDDAAAAYFYGAVREQIPSLVRVLSPQQVEAHDAVLEKTRRALGAERFEAEARRGAALPAAEAVEAALAYVTDAQTAFASREQTAPAERSAEDRDLTIRQREVLDLLVAGLSNKEIAARLGISPKTVMHHTTAIYRVLGVRGRAEAAVAAVRMRTQ